MLDEGRTNCCPKCGGTMIGDNYTTASHCENAELPEGIEADGGPVYCNFTDAPDTCLVERDIMNGDFDCGHEYAGEITCDECKHGACAVYGMPGLDPRYPRDCQPPATTKPKRKS